MSGSSDSMTFYNYEGHRFLRRLILTIVYFIVIISFAWFIVYGFMGQTIINGQSMSPVLNAGDACLINRLSYDLSEPRRFDIIAFTREDTGKLNVKRVVGLPGETIQIKNESLYIDGEKITDDRVGRIYLAGIAENEIHMGDDEYFVLGDNNESSEDSRFVNIGVIKKDLIYGRIWFKIRPLSELGFVH